MTPSPRSCSMNFMRPNYPFPPSSFKGSHCPQTPSFFYPLTPFLFTNRNYQPLFPRNVSRHLLREGVSCCRDCVTGCDLPIIPA